MGNHIRHFCVHTVGTSGYCMHVSKNQGISVKFSAWLYLHIQIQIQILETPLPWQRYFYVFSFKSSSFFAHITEQLM